MSQIDENLGRDIFGEILKEKGCSFPNQQLFLKHFVYVCLILKETFPNYFANIVLMRAIFGEILKERFCSFPDQQLFLKHFFICMFNSKGDPP